jgi:SM-20-related protein
VSAQLAIDPAAIEALVEGLDRSGFLQVPALAPPALAASLREHAQELMEAGDFQPARIGFKSLERRAEIRGDSIRWIDNATTHPALRVYLDFIEQLRVALNRRLMLGAWEHEGHFAVFPPGKGYQRHVDASPHSPRRLVTLVLYLNEDWREEDGGALVAWTRDGNRHATCWPESGHLVAFLSAEIPHEVQPAQRERWSLTGWLCQRGAVA